MQKATKTDELHERLELLHELDDEAFEQERKRIIEAEISKYPPNVQDRLRKFQWTLDMKRRKCKNPLEACFMFHEMLMEQVYGENGLLENLERLVQAAGALSTGANPAGAALKNNKSDNSSKKATDTFVVSLADFRKNNTSCHGQRVSGN